jgi:hypothetical protein
VWAFRGSRRVPPGSGSSAAIDWNDPDAIILSSVWENGPWSETEATTKQYDQIGPYFTAQIDEQRERGSGKKTKKIPETAPGGRET